MREEWNAWAADRLPPAIERIPVIDRESQISMDPEEAAQRELDALRQFIAERG